MIVFVCEYFLNRSLYFIFLRLGYCHVDVLLLGSGEAIVQFAEEDLGPS